MLDDAPDGDISDLVHHAAAQVPDVPNVNLARQAPTPGFAMNGSTGARYEGSFFSSC